MIFDKKIISSLLLSFGLIVSVDAFANSSKKPHISGGQEYLNSCKLALGKDQQISLDKSLENSYVQDFEKFMKTWLIGQEPAAQQYAGVLRNLLAGLNDLGKPLSSALLVGPTGVGKTESVKVIIRFLNENPDIKLLRVDGGELQEDHAIARLIGAPAGYAGYEDMPLFHQENIDKVTITIELPNGDTVEMVILLLDELEKMTDNAFKLALGILDEGKVTLANGSKVSFRKAFVIGTSNQGAKDVEKLIEARSKENERKRNNNIQISAEEEDLTGRVDKNFREKILETYRNALKRRFSPEFLNRWEAIIQFLHLNDENFYDISNIFLAKLQKRIYRQAKVKFGISATPNARWWLVKKGTDFKNGAREMSRTIKTQLTNVFANMIITEQINEGDVIQVDEVNGELVFKVIGRELKREQLLEFADREFPNMGMAKVKFDVVKNEEKKASVEIYRVIESQLNSDKKALELLWKVANKDSEVITRQGSVEISGKSKMTDVSLMYIKIGGKVFHIRGYSARGFEGRVEPHLEAKFLLEEQLPSDFEEIYGNGKIADITIEYLQNILETAGSDIESFQQELENIEKRTEAGLGEEQQR